MTVPLSDTMFELLYKCGVFDTTGPDSPLQGWLDEAAAQTRVQADSFNDAIQLPPA